MTRGPLWSDWRYEVDHGPTPALEWAWDETLSAIVTAFLDRMTADELLFASAAADWRSDSSQVFDHRIGIDPRLILCDVRERLHRMADAENFR